MGFVVYILESEKDKTHYIGQCRDIKERLSRHNEGRVRSTKSRGPWKVIYSEEYHTRSEAVRREREIKKRKSREFVVKLIRGVAQFRSKRS